jgi:hypothetical protein
MHHPMYDDVSNDVRGLTPARLSHSSACHFSSFSLFSSAILLRLPLHPMPTCQEALPVAVTSCGPPLPSAHPLCKWPRSDRPACRALQRMAAKRVEAGWKGVEQNGRAARKGPEKCTSIPRWLGRRACSLRAATRPPSGGWVLPASSCDHRKSRAPPPRLSRHTVSADYRRFARLRYAGGMVCISVVQRASCRHRRTASSTAAGATFGGGKRDNGQN